MISTHKLLHAYAICAKTGERGGVAEVTSAVSPRCTGAGADGFGLALPSLRRRTGWGGHRGGRG